MKSARHVEVARVIFSAGSEVSTTLEMNSIKVVSREMMRSI